jgi:hypothetical protein
LLDHNAEHHNDNPEVVCRARQLGNAVTGKGEGNDEVNDNAYVY